MKNKNLHEQGEKKMKNRDYYTENLIYCGYDLAKLDSNNNPIYKIHFITDLFMHCEFYTYKVYTDVTFFARTNLGTKFILTYYYNEEERAFFIFDYKIAKKENEKNVNK